VSIMELICIPRFSFGALS